MCKGSPKVTSATRARSGVLAGLLLLVTAVPAVAAEIVVNTVDDDVAANGNCSLREAVRAANTNTAQDACPAGSSAGFDTITLQAGATYALTIAGDDDDGLLGDLDVLNDAAAKDLLITAPGGSTATIAQDAKPDDRVLSVAAGASVVLRGLVITGGASTSGQHGGAVQVGIGAALGIDGCAFTGNVANFGGGAIDVDEATLLVQSSLFARNVATSGAGGAIRSTKNASVTIVDSVFEDNDAGASSGGAVSSGAGLAISGSTFVGNRATAGGGAFAAATGAFAPTSITGSCLVGNADPAVQNTNNTTIDATGNWWGSSDGPAGELGGSGDATDSDVDGSAFAKLPLAACRPLELVPNGRFGVLGPDGLPDRWRLRRLDQVDDRVACSQGRCALQIVGDGELNQAVQTVLVPGEAGDTVTVRATAAAKNVPASAGKFQVEVSLIHADGSRQRKTLKFGTGSFSDTERSKTIVATERFVRLKVRAMYGRASGRVRFTDVSAVLE
jgi:CSLREA domain-containing protein